MIVVVDASAAVEYLLQTNLGVRAGALLEDAVKVVENARLRTYGDAQQRAAFFAQFAPAFEQLVAWCVRDGDVPAAVAAVARGRSRTLLDQLLLANVDPELAFRPAQKVLIASLLVIAAIALRRLTLAANKLWTRRYIQSTIPTP